METYFKLITLSYLLFYVTVFAFNYFKGLFKKDIRFPKGGPTY